MKKKLLAGFLVAAMALSLVACGGSKNETATESTDGAEATESSAEIECPKEITVMTDEVLVAKDDGLEEFTEKLQELTGIEKINVIMPDHDAYYDVLGQTIASGEWPDVIMLSSSYYADYSNEGVLWDMTDMYEGSDLQSRIDENGSTSVIDALRINDRLYGMAIQRGNGCVTYVKQAWLDACGLEVPTTYDEYITMLDAFHNGDPDGDGKNGNTYGVSAAGFIGGEAPFTNYFPEFYQDAYPAFYQNEAGEWVDGFTEQSMKDALQRLQDAYAKGYIDPSTLDQGTSDARNKFYDDEFGVFTYWAGSWASNLKKNLESNGLSGELVALEPLAEVGQYVDRVPTAWCISSTCQNPEGVYKYFIEPIQDGGDVQFLWTYGVEDVHYSTKAGTVLAGTDKEMTYEDGQFHMLEKRSDPTTTYSRATIDPALALVPLANDPAEETTGDEAIFASAVFNNNCKNALLVPSTDAMTQYNGDLTTLKNGIVAQVVLGKMSVEEGYKKFEDENGSTWSQQIVDSLNALNQ